MWILNNLEEITPTKERVKELVDCIMDLDEVPESQREEIEAAVTSGMNGEYSTVFDRAYEVDIGLFRRQLLSHVMHNDTYFTNAQINTIMDLLKQFLQEKGE